MVGWWGDYVYQSSSSQSSSHPRERPPPLLPSLLKMKPALFLRPRPPYLGRDVEAAGHAGGVAVELADVRPVHVEFLGKLLQLRQVVHAALDGYADEIQLGVALVNIHEFGNDGDARLAPCPPEVEQGVIAAEFDGFALDVLCGNGWGAETFVGCGRRGRVGKRCDADAALLTAEIMGTSSSNAKGLVTVPPWPATPFRRILGASQMLA